MRNTGNYSDPGKRSDWKNQEDIRNKGARQERPYPGTESVRNRRRKGHFRAISIFAVIAIFFLLGAVLGYDYYDKHYKPSTEQYDLNQYFDVAGDNVEVYLNDQKERTSKGYLVVGRAVSGHVYLPYDYVIGTLNERFYWDDSQSQILYTLPTDTVMTSEGDRISDGSACFIREGSDLYLNVDWVKQYTNIRFLQNITAANKRIFIYTDWNPYTKAVLKKDEAVRFRGGVKSPVLTNLTKGSEVKVLDTMEKWAEVLTPDGLIGYLRLSRLENIQETKPESSYTEPDFSHISFGDGTEKIVLGFHQVTAAKANDSVDKLVSNAAGMNVIAPTWFSLSSEDGDFISYADQAYVDKMHGQGISVWASVNNFENGSVVDGFLKNYGLRQQLIEGLISAYQSMGIDGINVDFEQIPSEYGRDYVEFMRELSAACRKTGLLLSVDCYVPYEFNSYYDIKELGNYCDYVIIMCYDEHYAGSKEAGSVSSIGYVDRGIQGATADIDSGRVIIGVPFYTRVWVTENGTLSQDAFGITRAQQWINDKGIKLQWDEETGQNYGSIDEDGKHKEIWMEDSDSMTLKMKHIREASVGGVAAWKLGQEPEGFWSILDLNTEPADPAEMPSESIEAEEPETTVETASEPKP